MSVYENNVRRRNYKGTDYILAGDWVFGCKAGHTTIRATMIDEEEGWVMIECGNKNCGNILWYNGA
tara:strand:- start:1064 stop:1261 length:198 start_codon:yes stop_codon:yes gene_type:complete